MTSWDKYAGKARDWSEAEYASTQAYLSHRAEIVRTLGPPLAPGDVVLDLACGDGGLADYLPEQRYVGVDASELMVDAGLGRARDLTLADLNDYVPPQPVQATTIFRAIYYARDRRALLTQIAAYTEKKLVFDLNPRQYAVEDVLADIRTAGFGTVELRPFFVPQTVSLPGPVLGLARTLERSGPLARAALRARFTYLVAASR